MKVTLTINGKQVDTEVNESEIKSAMKRTGYEVKNGRYYTYANAAGTIEGMDSFIHGFDQLCEAGCIYSDERVAENNGRADKLMRNLRRFAAEHGGCVSPKDRIIGKAKLVWCISYNRIFEQVMAYPMAFNCMSTAGFVMFSSQDSAQKAIDEFRSELTWYFTEYDPMPEGWWD